MHPASSLIEQHNNKVHAVVWNKDDSVTKHVTITYIFRKRQELELGERRKAVKSRDLVNKSDPPTSTPV